MDRAAHVPELAVLNQVERACGIRDSTRLGKRFLVASFSCVADCLTLNRIKLHEYGGTQLGLARANACQGVKPKVFISSVWVQSTHNGPVPVQLSGQK